MILPNKKEMLILFLGDIVIFYASLWVVLAMRDLRFPSSLDISMHIAPFSILIAVWILTYYIAGLYSKHTLLFRRKLPSVILRTQLTNILIAIAFFYLIPYFVITPKTNLFLYILISFFLILWWRLYGTNTIGNKKKNKAILIGGGKETSELKSEINLNTRYSLAFSSFIDLGENKNINIKRDIIDHVREKNITAIVIDINNKKIEPFLPYLYALLFSKVRFIPLHKLYEELFDRIPLSITNYKWFLENISTSSIRIYDVLKRVMDISLSLILGIFTLPLYPFVCLAIKFDDKGPVFIRQDRVGLNNKIINIIKFRTMEANDRGKWVVKNDPRITRVGQFLRVTRIDELPQLWNIFMGDLSLIGPRPELPDLVRLYEKKIPYYKIRHLIKPGLSGWGQIHHEKPPHSIEETKEKLSYDLYYIKNRSLLLDIEIALKTIRTLLSRSGI